LRGPLWSWLYGSWIYNYLCNQCLSPLTLWIRIPLRRCVLHATVCDKVCQWLAAGRRFSLHTFVSSTNKTDLRDITEIEFLKLVGHRGQKIMRSANNVGNAGPLVRQTFLNDVFTFLMEVGNAGRIVNTGTSSVNSEFVTALNTWYFICFW
jgi:hypothetical protein